MSYYDEEFYGEPSEFEQQVDEFKRSITNAIKEEFQQKMISLEAENAELQIVKKDFDKIKTDYRNKEMQIENERSGMERKIRSERLKDLFKDHEVIMFCAESEREGLPKCDKCNEKRRVEYITPLGKGNDESCDCAKTKRVYKPKEYVRTEFKYNEYGRGIIVWYKPYNNERDGYSSGNVPNSIYEKGMSFESIEKSYGTYFRDPSDCQLYCDWLNEKEVYA